MTNIHHTPRLIVDDGYIRVRSRSGLDSPLVSSYSDSLGYERFPKFCVI